ncbi:type III secretion protein HrpB4 [Variovorax sp. 770b2]|uniref:type III secretion protein HrpB4 n=1 Tax=Variovorax sp. 770b2 TaxID=1566271 RepID=UPI0008F292AF|nr:type III secretion protein HrpB4 [Variovorax sp. 770b2]SFQ04423.1 type III secretion protein (HrpB4) [Variovorax sp. 770b2]
MKTSLARLLQAVDRKAASWQVDLHPAWVDKAFGHLGDQAAASSARLPPGRQAALLEAIFGLAWPSLAEFRDPVHRLVLLDRDSLLKVLAVFALDTRRESIRRSVGRAVRKLLIDGVGESAYEKLTSTTMRGLQVSNPLAVPDVAQERLAAEGFRLMRDEGVWHHPVLTRMARLSLPLTLPEAPLRLDGAAPEPASRSIVRVIEGLPQYFPELEWLFGSDMDRALSA